MPSAETIARQESKARILRIANKGGDWQTVADALDVNYKTAWLWVNQERKADLLETAAKPKLPWGGKRAEKIKREHLEFLEHLLSDNCFLTLREMAEALKREFGLQVAQQTIQKRLYCLFYSLRKAPPTTVSVTTATQQLHAFATHLQTLEAAGKRFFYVDETNYNLWCAKKMERCRNTHVLACLSQHGVAHWEHTAGALQPSDAAAFMRRALDAIVAQSPVPPPAPTQTLVAAPLGDVVVVLDTSSTFATALELAACALFAGVTLLQLPPAAAALALDWNPCARVLTMFRAAAKQFLLDHLSALRAVPESTTAIEHRTTYLLAAAQRCFPASATPALCCTSVADVRARIHALLSPASHALVAPQQQQQQPQQLAESVPTAARTASAPITAQTPLLATASIDSVMTAVANSDAITDRQDTAAAVAAMADAAAADAAAGAAVAVRPTTTASEKSNVVSSANARVEAGRTHYMLLEDDQKDTLVQ